MSSTTYVRYELMRMLRNRRFFLFSLGFPLVLYFLIAGPNRHEHNLAGSGISAPLYFMVGLAAFGTMNSVHFRRRADRARPQPRLDAAVAADAALARAATSRPRSSSPT